MRITPGANAFNAMRAPAHSGAEVFLRIHSDNARLVVVYIGLFPMASTASPIRG
ncbi:hypothetical protein HND25_04140 [Rhodococcus erythropolis]|uniref:Uncharacterized protein n=1 Tax=Rhodococcus erythropolis TaxID=1833 RepID=A0A8I1D9C6_RHOER|nr:hypothetical protein [Rhodococcus erythropolis]MBH5146087.1 hypothetical protein [Rhodococcus erythropolis]MBO8145904.1 hypothetical protein [Rhodococcus erythropolis]MDO1487806.1 hypothetical protein [Rhodococcus erythropolis]